MAPKRDVEASNGGHNYSQSYAERPKKKLRTFTEEDVKLAKIWDKLASDDELERLTFAAELVKYYSSILHSGEHGADGQKEVITENGVQKVEVRLLRGLCSSRKSARIGFSLALTEVLRVKLGTASVSKLSLEERVAQYLRDVERGTRPELGASSQEKRDALLGKVFAISSLVHSGISVESEDGRQTLQKIVEFVCLSMMQSEWPWLAEEFGLVCCQLVRTMADCNADPVVAEDILSIIHRQGLGKTREGIAIWLEVQSCYPSVTCPPNIWHKDDPLSKKETSTVAKIMHSTKIESESKGGSGAREQRPHFAWMILLRRLFQRDSTLGKSGKESLFKRFWLEAVDNMFFASTASPEKKAVGFQLFTQVVTAAPPDALMPSFSPKLMKCLINQSAQPNRYLNTTAKGLLESMVSRAKSDSEAAPVILSALISGHGDIDIDRLTKSKTAAEIFSNAQGESLKRMIRQYEGLLVSPAAEKHGNLEVYQQKIADQLVARIRQQTSESYDLFETKGMVAPEIQIIKFFLGVGYYTEGAKHFSSKTQEMFRNKYLACLAHVAPKQPDKAVELLATAIDDFAKHSSGEVIALVGATEDAKRSLERAMKTFRDVKGSMSKQPKDGSDIEANEKRPQIGLAILLAMTLLQAYNGDTDAITMLTELESCRPDLLGSNPEARGEACTAIIEVILSFSAQQSAMNRKLSEQAFGELASDVNEDGLRALLDVLQQKEGVAGQAALFGENDEQDGDENGSSGGDSEVGSDVEEVEDDSSNSTSAADDSDDDSDATSSSTSDDSTSSELAEFESKLASLLKTQTESTSTDDDNDANSSSDESLMDDDQMLALDSTLSTMFRQRGTPSTSTSDPNTKNKTNTRAAHKAAKENVLAFKNRVLALLSIYLKRQHANPLALGTILPLLELIRTTRNAQVGARASGLLLDVYFPAAKKRGLPGDISAEAILQMLDDVMKETTAWVSREHVKCGSRACLFLARVALAAAEGEGKKERKTVAKKIGKMYDEARGGEKRPDWQEGLWRDWEEFSRQVVDVKSDAAKSKV